MSYLKYCIQETLRFNVVSDCSMLYRAKSDCKFCDIEIPKDTLVRFKFDYEHMNPTQWHEPEKFIPERFDPTNKLYLRPNCMKFLIICLYR